MIVDPRTPCIVGVAQRTFHRNGSASGPEPLEMWEQVSLLAARDARTESLLGEVDSLQLVYCQTWQYDDPTGRLAERLGITPDHCYYSGIGGTTGQQLLRKAAEDVYDGTHELVLVAGAEALASQKLFGREQLAPPWSYPHPAPPPMPFEAPFHPAEMSHDIWTAVLTFSLFEIARRARLGIAPDVYRAQLGELMAPFSQVAAANPKAWLSTARSAQEIATATATNRYVNYPYTKYMAAIMEVDMAAALLVTSHERADALRIPQDKRVYPRGHGYSTDPVYLAEHRDLSVSPAMWTASQTALGAAGVQVDEIKYLDLYSCFPAAINLACDALGIEPGVDRPLTVTGGLAYFGGPASNYMTHSLVQMVETLRDEPGSFGMVSGVGMHMTKHVFGIYSTEPGPWQVKAAPARRLVTDRPDPLITMSYDGPATLASYGVSYARDNTPSWLLALCDLPDGSRCYAKSLDAEMVSTAVRDELVGISVHVQSAGAHNKVAI